MLGSGARVSQLMSESASAGPAAQVRPAVIADYPQIASLEVRYGLHAKPYDEWQHLWVGNPACKDPATWTIGWVVENDRQEVVGYVGNVPSLLEFRGQTLLAVSGRGLVVDDRYRSYAFPLFSKFINQPGVDLIINTTVNAQALKLHELFRCNRVPVGAWNRSVFWITHYREFAAKLAATKHLPLPSLVSYPLAAVLAVKDFTHRKLDGKVPNGFELSVSSSFDERFDLFWEELRARRQHTLLTNRRSDALNWHFYYATSHGRAWVETITSNGKLHAYAIFVRQDNHVTGLNRLRLVDFQALDGTSEMLIPMLSVACERCRDQGIHMLEVIGFSPAKKQVLAPFAPHHRDLPCWLYFYKAKDKTLAEILKDPSVWDPSPFDGDGAI